MLRKICPILLALSLAAFLGCGGEEETKPGGGEEPIPTEKYDTLYDVFFVSELEGWAVGENSAIIHTTDGGKTWESQSENVKWLSEGENKYVLYCVQFTDEKTGWIVGEKGVLLRTTDGGATWEQIDTGVQDVVLRSITIQHNPSATPPDAAWIVGTGGTILFSNDGGQTWIKQDSPVNKDLYSVTSIGYYQGGWKVWAAGQDGVIIFTGDGLTWQEQKSGIPTTLLSIFFANVSPTEKEFRGWAVGVNGVVRATTDFGKTWKPQDADAIGQHLRDVFFMEKTPIGWIVGDGGLVRYTRDAGKTWRMRASGVFKTLYAVHFVNTSEGWAVGKDGVVIHTTDSGTHWEVLRGSPF
ncbi:hypothetical protein DRP77_13625 [Candidatus Poribacteria bacterium]|nr:MAG: hypothetical protein DRP77_13625 [Candidatus Poribacteria bacterium]